MIDVRCECLPSGAVRLQTARSMMKEKERKANLETTESHSRSQQTRQTQI